MNCANSDGVTLIKSGSATNKDGSFSMSGVIQFKGTGAAIGDSNGLAAFSINFTKPEEGAIRMQTNIVGENKNAMEFLYRELRAVSLFSYEGVLTGAASLYYKASPYDRWTSDDLEKMDVPTENTSSSDVTVRGIQDGDDFSILEAKNTNDKNYLLTPNYDEKQCGGKKTTVRVE